MIAEKHQNSTMGLLNRVHHVVTTHPRNSLQTQDTHAPLQIAHLEEMKSRPYDEPVDKPTPRRRANGGGVMRSSSTTSKTKKKAALTYIHGYSSGGASSLPSGRSLRVKRQQHQHRSLWMACSQCLCGKRAEEWGSKLRQFLMGELPASLSLPTKIRIVLEVSMVSTYGWCGWQGTFCKRGGKGRRQSAGLVLMQGCGWVSGSLPRAWALMIEEIFVGIKIRDTRQHLSCFSLA
jgi:hypothetical protein